MQTILMNITFKVMDMNKGRVVPGAKIKDSYWKAIEVESEQAARAAIDEFIKQNCLLKADDGN